MASQTEDIIAVNQLAEDCHAAWLNDDPEALLALYTEDAVLILSNEPAVIGKEALRTLYQYVFGNYTFTGNSERVEVEVVGDWGYVWGTYTSTGTPKAGVGGEPMTDHGNSMYIVRRQHDGSWRIARMMSTRSDQPRPASQ